MDEWIPGRYIDKPFPKIINLNMGSKPQNNLGLIAGETVFLQLVVKSQHQTVKTVKRESAGVFQE